MELVPLLGLLSKYYTKISGIIVFLFVEEFYKSDSLVLNYDVGENIWFSELIDVILDFYDNNMGSISEPFSLNVNSKVYDSKTELVSDWVVDTILSILDCPKV